MSAMTSAEYSAALRQWLSVFIARSFKELNPQTEYSHNWHIDAIADALEGCASGRIKRLIINVPPRSLKSHCVTIAFVAWLLGHKPSKQVICASYSQDLANKHALDCRTLMSSFFYKDLFPTRFSSQRQAVGEFVTTEKGLRLSTSVGGTLTGRGADLIIIDDPLKPDEAVSETQRKAVNNWYDHTLFSRLNSKNDGCIIIVMQRLHEDDLVGHVLGLSDEWKVLRFPAIAEENEVHVFNTLRGQQAVTRLTGVALHPERESIETLAKIRAVQGEYNFAGQYQQAPSPLGGGMVKLEWFKTYQPHELPEKFDLIFQSWDTANKASELSDFSACTTWGLKKQNLYLLDVFKKRMEYPELKRTVKEMAKKFEARNVLIEDKASGTQLIQELYHEELYATTKYEPKGDKILRMHSASSLIEGGNVFLPAKATWKDSYLNELASFPMGKHDDQADSTSQALDWSKLRYLGPGMGIFHYYREQYIKIMKEQGLEPDPNLL
jgi:predicted phage terminase large subunit-like protein